MIYKITINNHIIALKFHTIGTVVMISTFYFLKWDHEAVMVFSFFWLAYFIPAIYLHIEYYLKNRGHRLEILQNEIILHGRNGKVSRYRNLDLQKKYFINLPA